jgi:predicted AAA+ superfamily ATPase
MTGRSIHNLSVESLGFNNKDISELSANEEYKSICKALKFPNWQKAVEYLVNRGFAFETSTNHYFLSSAGAAFCDAVIEAHDLI